VSHKMSSGFSLKFVSFLQNYPTCSCEGYACCSCRRVYALQLAEPFRHGDGSYAPLSEQLIPIAGITWLRSTPMFSYASPALFCQR
jgi:hypothetical protein